MNSRRLSSGLILILLSVILAGCAGARERSFKISEDWSRGNRIGTTSIRQPVALAADNEGAYLTWPVKTEDATRLDYVRLGPDGLVISDTILALTTIFPQSPQMLAGDDLHLFLVTRVESGQLDGVYHLPLSRDGQVLSEPQRLSGDDQKVGDVVARQAPNGDMHLVWDVIEGPGVGVYHGRLDPDGTLVGFPQLIGPDGHRPSAQFGADGTLYLAWMLPVGASRQDIYYTSLAPGAEVSNDPVRVADPRISSTDLESAPVLAVDGSDVAIFWSVEHRTGLAAGSAELSNVTFPADDPDLQVIQTIHVPDEAKPRYQQIDRFAPADHVAVPAEGDVWTGFIEMPQTLPWSGSGVAVLANMTYDFRVNPRSQLGLLMVENGQLAAYQQPALTRQFSLHPTGAVSPDGQLHAAWIDLESPGEYSVYYASTRPGVVAALDQRTGNDTFNDTVDLAWGMASGLTLLPLSIIAALPIIVVMGIYYITGHDGSLRGNLGAQFALVVALVLYLTTKLIIMGGLLDRPPFMNVVPESFAIAWAWIVSVAIAGIALVSMLIYIRRNKRPELLKAALLFFAVDALMTLLLYGPTFYGE